MMNANSEVCSDATFLMSTQGELDVLAPLDGMKSAEFGADWDFTFVLIDHKTCLPLGTFDGVAQKLDLVSAANIELAKNFSGFCLGACQRQRLPMTFGCRNCACVPSNLAGQTGTLGAQSIGRWRPKTSALRAKTMQAADLIDVGAIDDPVPAAKGGGSAAPALMAIDDQADGGDIFDRLDSLANPKPASPKAKDADWDDSPI